MNPLHSASAHKGEGKLEVLAAWMEKQISSHKRATLTASQKPPRSSFSNGKGSEEIRADLGASKKIPAEGLHKMSCTRAVKEMEKHDDEKGTRTHPPPPKTPKTHKPTPNPTSLKSNSS